MITFFSDPHLGRSAKAHTTPLSRVRLDKRIKNQALSLFVPDPPRTVDAFICLGDLFHNSHNAENIIKSGAEIVFRCDIVLAGNHDLSNRVGGNSSLQLLSSIDEFNDRIIIADIDEIVAVDREIDGTVITFIPHHTSQELFEKALYSAGGGDILCLHCNVDNSFVEGNDSALNISSSTLEEMLKLYNYILIGHEHNHREMFNGRVKILGNTHPTSFSDISDKYIHHYDPVSDTWENQRIWVKHLSFISLPFWALGSTVLTEYDFVEVTGPVETLVQVKELTDNIKNIWHNCPNLLMLRNSTEVVALDDGNVLVSEEDLENLVTVIDRMVKGTFMAEIWKKYKEVHDA